MLSNNVKPVAADSKLDSKSTNYVQNKVITEALAGKADKGHTHTIDILTSDPVNPANGYMWIKKP